MIKLGKNMGNPVSVHAYRKKIVSHKTMVSNHQHWAHTTCVMKTI
jgi:hypothetical protein